MEEARTQGQEEKEEGGLMPTNSDAMFRKKYAFALMIFAVGCVIAFETNASLESFTTFGAFLLGIFGAQDLVDKKLENK